MQSSKVQKAEPGLRLCTTQTPHTCRLAWGHGLHMHATAPSRAGDLPKQSTLLNCPPSTQNVKMATQDASKAPVDSDVPMQLQQAANSFPLLARFLYG